MKQTIVVYPFLGMGHLVAMVEFAKKFLLHQFDISVVVMDSPLKLPPAISFIESITASYHPAITFHDLPPAPKPSATDPTVLLFDYVRVNNANFRNFLISHSKSCSVRAVILDFFFTDTLGVTAELGLPSYFFYTSGACDLAVFLYLSVLDKKLNCSYKDLGGTPVDIPGCPPLPADHMMAQTMDRDSLSYKELVYQFDRMANGDGILVNTFESLEARAVQAIRAGLCTPGRRTAPLFCIGPVIAERQSGGTEVKEKHASLVWLDSQPRSSVVFLCFGSMAYRTFSAAQLKEIALGLERTQQRFIWVVRSPREEHEKSYNPMAEPKLEHLLPEGFLERTKDRGMVLKIWAPQTEILAHEAVGGFVTHCGWNSTLESVVNGVPMIAWPMYAEQKMNKVWIVEEMKLGVEMEGYDKELVAATEVETKIRWLMASEGGKEMRERAMAMKHKATEAWGEDGSSYKDFMELVRAVS